MFFDGIHVRTFKQAKANISVFVVKEIDMADPEFVRRRHAEFFQV